MDKNLQTRGSTKKFLLFLLGVIIITLQAGLSQAQIFTETFDGATFPPVGPPSVSNPVGTGTADEGEVKWYRGDTSIVNTSGGAQTPNAGINPGRGGAGFAVSFNSWDINNGAKADLIVNDINLSNISPFAVLKFWMINKSGTDVVRVFARNGNDPWTQVGNASYGVFANFTEISISLQAFSGPGKTSVDIRFEGTSDYGADNIGIDDIAIDLPSPMSYVSSTSFQKANNVEIFKPLPNQEIIRLSIVTTGASNPLTASNIYLSTTGTTNLSDISNAKLWTTGGTATFNASSATLIGSPIASPSGVMTFTSSTPLIEGTNYYWLTYDITSGATLLNSADATFDSLKIGSTTYIPTLSSPTPARRIAPASVFNTNAIAGSTSGNGRGPATQSLFNRTMAIYPASDYPNLKNGDLISTIGFNIMTLGAGQVTVSGNIKLYISNTTDASFQKSTTWATTIADMTLVYDGPLTINPETGSYDIRLTAPFTYTGGAIYCGYDWALTTAVSSAAIYDCNSSLVGGSNGLRNAFGASQAATISGSSNFRPAIRFGVNSLANDVNVAAVYTLTQMPQVAGAPHQVRALITNNGFNPLSNYSVNLNIKGANTFNNSKTISALAFGESSVVTFDGFSPNANGTDTVTVSVANDDNNANNSRAINQQVTTKIYSYSDNSAPASSIGYNTGSGNILNKYKATGAWIVDSVRVFIANTAAIDGKKMYGVVVNSQGVIIAKSDTFTATATDLGKLKSFAIVNPKVVSNEDFYVGLHQVANAVGFFPVAYQAESPARSGAYYTLSNAGALAEANTFGRFMIDASVGTPTMPAPVVNIGVDTSICDGTTLTLDAGNAGMTYLWSTGATTQTIDVNTSGTYSVTVRNAEGNPTTDSRVVTVDPILPVSVSIAQNPTGIVCGGQSVTFTATPTNGGTAPTYQWLKNGTIIPSETGSTYTTSTLANNDVISAILVSNEKCKSGSPDTSNTITMSVSAGLAPVTLNVTSSSPAGSCNGTSVTLTATPSNGGSAPVYEWRLNGVLQASETGATYTSSSFANNDTVTCTVTSNSACISGSATVSAGFRLKVNPVLPVSVSIAADVTGAICLNQTVTFTATPTNGGSSPSYVWKVSGVTIPNQTGNTLVYSSFVNGDSVTATLTSSETCQSGGPAVSSAKYITLSPVADAQFTSSASYRTVTFTNSSVNSDTYAWDFGDNGTSTSANPTHTYSADGVYAVRLISTNSCGNDTITKNVDVKTIDVQPLGLVNLTSGCALSNLSVIRVNIQNLRPAAVQNLKVAYQVNGGAVVNGVMLNLNGGATTSFPFIQRADLSADGTYTIKVWTNDSLDFDRSNDTIVVTIVNQARPNASFTLQQGAQGSVAFTNTSTSEVAATYTWNFGDGGTSTSESPTHTYTLSGTYTVTMIATNACGNDTATSTVTVVLPGMTLQANEKLVRAYPNPNNGSFSIDLQLTQKDDININIFNANGQLVHTQSVGLIDHEIVNVDLSTLSPGVYNVNIQGKNTQITKRVNVIK